jgi:hypothetical protein
MEILGHLTIRLIHGIFVLFPNIRIFLPKLSIVLPDSHKPIILKNFFRRNYRIGYFPLNTVVQLHILKSAFLLPCFLLVKLFSKISDTTCTICITLTVSATNCFCKTTEKLETSNKTSTGKL